MVEVRKPKVLIADDEESLRIILQEVLESEGFAVKTARDGVEAFDMVQKEPFDVLLTDIRMPGKTGIQLLSEVKDHSPRTQVIVMTSHASLETSTEALRKRANDYIIKPFQDLNQVAQLVRRATEQVRLQDENVALLENLKTANAKLSESNAFLDARAATIATLLDYSQAISALLTPEVFASETAAALTRLASGRRSVFFQLSQDPNELVPGATAGLAGSKVHSYKLASTFDPKSPAAVIAELEKTNELGRSLVPPVASSWLSPVLTGGTLAGVVAVFEAKESVFPASVRATLDRFAHQVRQSAENIALHESLKNLAIRDGLTGLYNHRYFQDRMIQEYARARRHSHDLSLIFIDIDKFKVFNDTHGHPRGDALLRSMSKLIKGSGRDTDVTTVNKNEMVAQSTVQITRARESDIVARYGGEEFVVILPETPLDGAVTRAERLRRLVEGSTFRFNDGAGLHVTISVGVSALRPEHKGPADIIGEADKAMYQAKSTGRNRVCVHGAVSAPAPLTKGGQAG